MYIINKHYLVNLKWEFSKGKINLAQHFRKKRESDIYNPIHIYIKNQWSNHLALLPNSKFKSTLEDESLPPPQKKSEWKEEERKGENTKARMIHALITRKIKQTACDPPHACLIISKLC